VPRPGQALHQIHLPAHADLQFLLFGFIERPVHQVRERLRAGVGRVNPVKLPRCPPAPSARLSASSICFASVVWTHWRVLGSRRKKLRDAFGLGDLRRDQRAQFGDDALAQVLAAGVEGGRSLLLCAPLGRPPFLPFSREARAAGIR
jgi:hypothetical protein